MAEIRNYFFFAVIDMTLYFGIPLAPAGQTPRYEVIIGTPLEQTSYLVESSVGEVCSGIATSSSPGVVTVDREFQVNSSEFRDRMKGLRVHASGENSIYVLVNVKYDFFGDFPLVIGYGSYRVHPSNENNDVSQYVYYAVSTDYGTTAGVNDRSNVLLIGNYENTSVTITPTQDISLPQNAQMDSSQVVVAAGTTHTVTLHSLQTLGFSNLLDLTGTKIVSNRPLTVITGHQCAQVPSDAGFCEPTYVHLPPTFNWGLEFLLAPFAGRTANQYYKLVTSMNSTVVEYRCGTQAREALEGLRSGSGRLLVIPSNSYCFLAASHPIFVVQHAPGFGTDNLGDNAIAAVAPISGHMRSTNFMIIPNDFPDNFITVTVQEQHFNASQIQLDGSILNCNWTNVYNTMNDDVVGHGCTFPVTNDVTHTVSHLRESGALSVTAYGWRYRDIPPLGIGYAYLTNFNLQPFNGKSYSLCTKWETYYCSTTHINIIYGFSPAGRKYYKLAGSVQIAQLSHLYSVENLLEHNT